MSTSPAITGTIDDPEFRTERARRAAYASHSTVALIGRFRRRLPEMTDDQLAIVRAALPPVREADDDAGR